MGYRADIQNLRISHTSLREKLTKQPLKDRKKKKKKKKKAGETPQLPEETKSLCLNTSIKTG
jgi:hypothetical protein